MLEELVAPTEIDLKIGTKLIHIDLKSMKEEESAVLLLIHNHPRITQRQIAHSEQWLGCHPVFEDEIGLTDKTETTLRRVRSIIRILRIKYKCPILSDSKGYWIPALEQEVSDCLERLEQTARSQAKSWMITYHELKNVFNVKSDYFETQKSLFEAEEKDAAAALNQAPDQPMKEKETQSGPPFRIGDAVKFTEKAIKEIATVADRQEHTVEEVDVDRPFLVKVSGFSGMVHETWLEKANKNK